MRPGREVPYMYAALDLAMMKGLRGTAGSKVTANVPQRSCRVPVHAVRTSPVVHLTLNIEASSGRPDACLPRINQPLYDPAKE